MDAGYWKIEEPGVLSTDCRAVKDFANTIPKGTIAQPKRHPTDGRITDTKLASDPFDKQKTHRSD